MRRFQIQPIVFLCLSFLLISAEPAYSEDASFTESGAGIPIYKKLKPLCQGNTLAHNGDEIAWEIYSSKAKPSEVLAGYQEKLGKQNFTPQGEGGTWKVSENSRISIFSSSEKIPISSCDKPAPRDALTLMLTSVFYRRSKK